MTVIGGGQGDQDVLRLVAGPNMGLGNAILSVYDVVGSPILTVGVAGGLAVYGDHVSAVPGVFEPATALVGTGERRGLMFEWQPNGDTYSVMLHGCLGVPTMAGQANDLCIRGDAPDLDNWLYRCTETGPAGAAVWTPVVLLGEALDSGWLAVAGLGCRNGWIEGTPSPQYRKAGNIVHLRGQIRAGVVGRDAFTLPPGYRPSQTAGALEFPCACNLGTGVFSVSAAGVVQTVYGDNAWYSINCSFPVD